jgi:hypothetical protein
MSIKEQENKVKTENKKIPVAFKCPGIRPYRKDCN